jgi:hypothetical protein
MSILCKISAKANWNFSFSPRLKPGAIHKSQLQRKSAGSAGEISKKLVSTYIPMNKVNKVGLSFLHQAIKVRKKGKNKVLKPTILFSFSLNIHHFKEQKQYF